MIGFNGGLIGKLNTPGGGQIIPGVWTLQEQGAENLAGVWVGPVDPNFSNVQLLMPGNGANNSINIVDRSTASRGITVSGSAKISTAQSVWGGSSVLFSTATDRLVMGTPLVNSTVSTFSVELWLRLTATPVASINISGLMSLDGGTGTLNYLSFGPLANNRLCLRWFDGASKAATGGTALNLNQWYFVSCIVNANAISMYVDGVQETLTGTTVLTNRNGTTGTSNIGSNNYGSIAGYVDDLRVTVGHARANVVPSYQFPTRS